MSYTVEFEQEIDGRWIAEVVEVPGVLAYGASRDEAFASVQALALRVLADQIDENHTATLEEFRFAAA